MKTTLCSSCVRNIDSPYIVSEWGSCKFCKNFQSHKSNLISNVKKIEGTFLETIQQRPSTGDYNCLVMVSGGKDSIMSLYKIKKEAGLRCLAYTFDNGFESEEALENIKKATDILEIDWILDKPGYMKKVYRSILKDQIPISLCRFCAPVMINQAIKLAHRYDIPYIITGRNKWQSDREPSRHALWNLPEDQLNLLIKKHPFLENIWILPEENEELLKECNIQITSPWIFEKRETEKYMKIIQKELWWETPALSYPKESTNCLLNFLQVVLSRKIFGYTHYDCEESLLIHYGERQKDSAVDILDNNIPEDVVLKILQQLDLSLDDIGLTKDEFHSNCKFFR